MLCITDMRLSISRISYCSADATYDRVFAFIATNKNETLECHAFLCPKRKMVSSSIICFLDPYSHTFVPPTSHDNSRWHLSHAVSASVVPIHEGRVLRQAEPILTSLRI